MISLPVQFSFPKPVHQERRIAGGRKLKTGFFTEPVRFLRRTRVAQRFILTGGSGIRPHPALLSVDIHTLFPASQKRMENRILGGGGKAAVPGSGLTVSIPQFSCRLPFSRSAFRSLSGSRNPAAPLFFLFPACSLFSFHSAAPPPCSGNCPVRNRTARKRSGCRTRSSPCGEEISSSDFSCRNFFPVHRQAMQRLIFTAIYRMRTRVVLIQMDWQGCLLISMSLQHSAG